MTKNGKNDAKWLQKFGTLTNFVSHFLEVFRPRWHFWAFAGTGTIRACSFKKQRGRKK
jgi:hypothetical protein